MSRLNTAVWKREELPALLSALAGHSDTAVGLPGTDISVWMDSACARLKLDVEPVDLWGFRVEEKLRECSPAVVETSLGWLAIVSRRGDRLTLLAPTLHKVTVKMEEVRNAICAQIEAKRRDANLPLIEACGLQGTRKEAALRALAREQSRYDFAGTLFKVRTPAGASIWVQARQAGIFGLLATFGCAHVAEYSLAMFAWYMLGHEALQGRVDRGWLIGWVLVLASMVPFRMLTTWTQGKLAISAGGLLKQRLLAGALKLAPEEVRHQGAGEFLARCIESEMVETLALSGGLMSILALIEVALAATVLWSGASGGLQTLALMVWTGLAGWAAVRYWKARAEWTASRLKLTHGLVERMTGHRTRLAQQPSADWHLDEDSQTADYEARSRAMDRKGARLSALIPAGWVAVGLLTLGPAFLGSSATPSSLAIAVGGVVLAWKAIKRLCGGAAQLSGAAIAWDQIKDLFVAASRESVPGLVSELPSSPEAALTASQVRFVRQNGRTVLNGVDVEVKRGDRVLVEGESGGGKSTLVSLLAGLRDPSGGLLLSGGLDRSALGESLWRRRVVAAPQYHENHIFQGPLAYNLLMGREWPAKPSEMERAQKVCEQLGLGPLLAKMPGGIMQMVGESGWQLSQGERSRVFMARALLQAPDVVILDESFAALDPETTKDALECALKETKTLMVVAHP